MTTSRLAVLLGGAVGAILFAGACDAGQRKNAFCQTISFEGDRFTVCHAARGQQRLALFDHDGRGRPYRHFAALPVDSTKVAFAMNAGMFDERGLPVGLFVTEGRAERPLRRRASGSSNFAMQPNGVFYGDAGGWHVATTAAYATDPAIRPIFATQSGPMLVISGNLNALSSPNGESRYIRNGVGIDARGNAWFAISAAPVSFGRFARLFRDQLHTPNALYFDGFVSSLWDPAIGRRDDGAELGPIVVALQNR